MATGGYYNPLSYSSTYGTTTYWELDRYNDERGYAKSPCVSCGLTHGASQMNAQGECEITQVKKLEAQEKIVKKHNDNIRKLYWERYTKGRCI